MKLSTRPMYTCPTCNHTDIAEEAMLKSRKRCKQCQREMGRSHYTRNKEKYDAVRRKRNPTLGKWAPGLVENALRAGHIRPMPCEVCGDLATNAHHDDYTKPLDVRWLCRTHHHLWHAQNGEALNVALSKPRFRLREPWLRFSEYRALVVILAESMCLDTMSFWTTASTVFRSSARLADWLGISERRLRSWESGERTPLKVQDDARRARVRELCQVLWAWNLRHERRVAVRKSKR